MGCIQENFVELLDGLDLSPDIARNLRFTHRFHCDIQALDLLYGGSLCAQCRHIAFNGCTHFKDLANAVFIDNGDYRAFIGLLCDPPFCLQLPQGFTNYRSAHIKEIAQLAFYQA
ncbi:hypothetical protein AA671_03245 [Delftia tsuruhatensis]|uniref:Pentapeptide repeat-containing protein n=1 Tax=Delftia tsuruhatensis TaxID=180282 RepID=A0ABM6E5S0_9BURK|nr:hypothetical protein BI380_15665 [Delftia tsuruhatensis]KLO61087.1 hypothetical protein AA671_03245 [Delftia tsuruhatensis]